MPASPSSLATALVLAGAASAQEWASWRVIGPFDHPQGAADIARVFPVERDLKVMGVDGIGMRLDRDHPGKGGVDVAWRELPGSAGELDVGAVEFARVLPRPPGVDGWSDNAVAYLYRTVTCARPVEVAVRMGSDDGLRFWLNGELLVDRAVARGLNVNDHSLVLPLKAGTNHLLAKVANGAGGWGYQLSGWSKISQASIDAAIDRGAQMLVRHQLLDGSMPGFGGYGSGLTALTGYCLLKCDVPARDPAVQRARAFVLAKPSPYTYSKSCELLFLCELKEPELRPVIEDRLDELIDWQEGSGLWAYPIHPGGNALPNDLSNTLYVALALRACEQVDVEVPARVWTRLLEGTLRCFEGVDKRQAAVTGPELGPPAGFSYRPGGKPITGSMTTAGVSVIEICRQGLGGELPGKFRTEAMRARRAGLAWIARNMSWGENPGQGAGHHFFFVYGVERVGSILGLEHVGGLNWYWDGAAWLVKAQEGSGAWHGGENFVDTILALLFLKRASAPPATGVTPARKDFWTTEDPNAAVSIAASGGARSAVWVVGFLEAQRERLEFPGQEGRGPRVARVRYRARPRGEGAYAEVGVVLGDEERGSAGERFALQHVFSRAGEWEVIADVEVLVPPTSDGLVPGRETLHSPPLVLRVADVLVPEQLEYPGHRTESLFHGLEVVASSSSQAGDQRAALAVDGRQDTRWLCDAGDGFPWLRLAVTRPIKGNAILLSHAHPRRSRAGAPRATRVGVLINGKEFFEYDVDPDPMVKTTLRLEEALRVRELELRVLEVQGGQLGRSSVGFAEVEFLRLR